MNHFITGNSSDSQAIVTVVTSDVLPAGFKANEATWTDSPPWEEIKHLVEGSPPLKRPFRIQRVK